MQYQIINTVTNKLDPDLSAAEAHGMASGMISVNHAISSETWLEELLQLTDEANIDDQSVLEELFDATYELLVNEDLAFTLLLPNDDVPLSLRLKALRDWCRGYLFGMSHATVKTQWPPEVLEIIKDMTELTKLDDEWTDEDAENDLMELTEYVKIGALFINTELNPVHNGTVH